MKRPITAVGLSFLSLVLIAGCTTTKDAKNLAKLSVKFSWSKKHRCSSTSPAFRIRNVPRGTKTLRFTMTDLNVPSYMHGGGTVSYKGRSKIPEGSFSYTGPCPPGGAHAYQFVVEAVNAKGDLVLGRGKAVRQFPPN